ncbi:HEXXH motif-containing putative peptide modification protein [Paucibacter sp. DJ4R-1]|nr:HEXXH motif-containing putative peptide modification protein [Paucibacter sp. DJ4R-1]
MKESEARSEGYSTSQWIASVPPSKVWKVTSQGAVDLSTVIELLPALAAQKLSSKGATFADDAKIATYGLAGLEIALSLLQQVPSLAETVGAVAKRVHILEASEPGFDISYSDPSIPFSVFLNISEGRFAALRTTEALVHEAMHLQLSLIEQLVPIAKLDQGLHYSPWKRSKRPVAGLMHALYVFRVVDQWLAQLPKTSQDTLDYAKKRRKEIGEEVEQLAPASLVDHLTGDGQRLLSRLLY